MLQGSRGGFLKENGIPPAYLPLPHLPSPILVVRCLLMLDGCWLIVLVAGCSLLVGGVTCSSFNIEPPRGITFRGQVGDLLWQSR